MADYRDLTAGNDVVGKILSALQRAFAPKELTLEDLTPQEKFLYMIHLNNLKNPVINSDGSVSTLRQMNFEQNGKTYNVPTVWESAIHSPDEAIKRAIAIGLDKYPSYGSSEEADARYEQMHKMIEADGQRYLQSRK